MSFGPYFFSVNIRLSSFNLMYFIVQIIPTITKSTVHTHRVLLCIALPGFVYILASQPNKEEEGSSSSENLMA